MTLLLTVASTLFAQEHPFSVPLRVSDGSHTDTLYFGIHPDASEGYNMEWDTLASPTPPETVVDMVLINANGVRLKTDVRDTVTSKKSFTVKYRAASGSGPVTFRWNSDRLDEHWKLFISKKSANGQELLGIDMAVQDSLNMSATPLDPDQDTLSIQLFPKNLRPTSGISFSNIDTLIYSDRSPLTFNLDSLISDPYIEIRKFTATSSDTLVAVDSLKNDTLEVIPRNEGTATIRVSATDQMGHSVQDSIVVAVHQPLSTNSTFGDLQLHPGDSRSFDNLDRFFRDGVAPVKYTAYSSNKSVSIELSDTSLTVQAQTIDTAEVTVRARDSLGREIAQPFNVYIHPINNAPPAAKIKDPSTDTLLNLRGEPSEQLPIRWNRVADQDSQLVTYTWEFSTRRDFSSDAVYSTSARPDTGSISLSYGTIDSVLAHQNISRGDTITAYHRVNTSDSIDVTEGPVQTFQLVRGHVAPYVNMQFIHNAPGLDTIDVYVNTLHQPVYDSLTFGQATSYREVPSGKNIELYLSNTETDANPEPTLTVNLNPNTPYQTILNGTEQVSVHLYEGKKISGKQKDRVTARVVHGLPGMLEGTAFRLKNYASPSQQVGVFESNMQFGNVSKYLSFDPAKVIFESSDHPRQFTFDFSNFSGQILTFVTSPPADTAKSTSTLSVYNVSAYDTSGRRYLPVETTPIDELQDQDDQPDEYILESNYPNPFNPSTEIGFALPKSTHVTLRVYNILGKQVETLVNKKMDAGYHSVIFEARDLTSGIYIYRLNTPEVTKTKKMLLVK